MDVLHGNKTRRRRARLHATRRQIKTHQTYLRCKISNHSLTLHILFHVNWFPRFTPAWRVLFARDIRFTRILLHRRTVSKSTLWVYTKLDLVSGMHARRLAAVRLGNSNNSNFPECAHAGRSLKGAVVGGGGDSSQLKGPKKGRAHFMFYLFQAPQTLY